MRLLVALLLFASIIAANSSGVQYLEVPAVGDLDSGTMINISVKGVSGSGITYVSTSPYAGQEFQQSINEVVAYISSKRNLAGMDFLVSTDASGYASLLDGPSAGVAMGIIIKSLSENKDISHDITITGGLDRNGYVIPVGALAQKAEVASQNGKKMLMVRIASVDDRIRLDKISKELNFPVVEYDSFDDAYNTFTATDSSYNTNLNYQISNANISSLQMREPDPMFSYAVEQLLNDLDYELLLAKGAYPDAYNYLDSKRRLARDLQSKGYSYSAGNEAFLALYKARVLNSNLSNYELIKLEERVWDCIESARGKVMNASSFSAYLNSELRLYWAEDEMQKVNESISGEMSLSHRMLAIESIARAHEWCKLSYAIAGFNDHFVFNKSLLEKYDEDLLMHYYANSEPNEHLEKAMRAYEEGYYGASLMEIIFYEGGENLTYDSDLTNYSSESDWSKMMQAHSDYLGINSDYGPDAKLSMLRTAYFYDLHARKLVNESIGSASSDLVEPKEKYVFGADSVENKIEFILLILISIFIPFAMLLNSLRRGL